MRAAILLLLAEQPMHGYQIIQEIASRSGGIWRPSPGAVYPALNLLQDEGLVEISSDGGRRLATISEAGQTYIAENAHELGDPWRDAAGRGQHPRHELRARIDAVAAAVHQVARTGDEDQAKEALAILDRARRDLYLVLAGPDTSLETERGTAGVVADAVDSTPSTSGVAMPLKPGLDQPTQM